MLASVFQYLSDSVNFYVSTPIAIDGTQVFELLRDDLAAIEREFGRDTVSGVRAITEIGEYLRAGGGKRLRPALLLLSSKLKVQASIQGDFVRVSGKDRDTLQQVIAMIKQSDFGIDMQFTNYRTN